MQDLATVYSVEQESKKTKNKKLEYFNYILKIIVNLYKSEDTHNK